MNIEEITLKVNKKALSLQAAIYVVESTNIIMKAIKNAR